MEELSNEFGWKLIVFSNLKISVNRVRVTPPQHRLFQELIDVDGNIFSSSIIQWIKKPSGEKSYNYFRDSKEHQKYRNL
ncbi:hypothetical protein CGH94_03890, partial [Vibrio parahaemolyticus]